MARLLTPEDEKAVADEVARAERSTAGEIVVTLARASSDYARQRMAVSFVFTLLGALALYEFVPHLSALWIVCGEAPLMALSFWVTGLSPVLRLVVRESARQEAVDARAKQLFIEQGVTETRQRSGVLLYLSEAEHRVELLADRGIHEHVGQEAWQKTVDVVVNEIRTGHPKEGIVRAVQAIGLSLGQHFPPAADDVNELADAPRRV
jgi:putative membrane protein